MFVFKKQFRPIFFSKFIFFYFFLITSYFLKNAIISGCLIYPIDFTCLKFIPWNSNDISRIITFNTEVMNKSYYEYVGNLSKVEYIENLNWISTWFKRNINEFLEFIATILICIFLVFISIKKYSSFHFKGKKIIYILSILLILSLAVAIKTPVLRMFHHIFLILGIIFLFFNFRNHKVYIKKHFFITFLVLILSFNFGKNFVRISQSNFINDPYRHVIKKGWYQEPKKMNLAGFKYYTGWIDAAPIGNERLDKYNYKKVKFFSIIYK